MVISVRAKRLRVPSSDYDWKSVGSRWHKTKDYFDAVASTSTASGYIASAVSEDIITGFPDGSFRPGDTVTRGQMAILLSRAFNLTEEAHYIFKDVPKDSKAYIHVKRIIAERIAEGYPDGSFQPDHF